MAFEKVWLDTGQKIKDSQGREHPMTVCAHSPTELKNYVSQGWTPVVEAVEEDYNAKRGKSR